MKKIIIVSIIILTIFGTISFVLTRKTSAPSAETGTPSNNSTDIVSSATVATHSSKSDCWTIINDSVYDITAYVSEHPGGNDITQACGNNGTGLFNNRDGSGDGHSPTADAILTKYKIGVLAN